MSGINGIFEPMKSSINKLILLLILTAIFSEIYSDIILFKLSAISIELSQSDKGINDENDSPFCFDTGTNDILNWNLKSDMRPIFYTSVHISPIEIFQLRAFSFFIWEPPEIA
jgi:hypothetical protein